MNYILTAATAVSKEAGSMSEMLPKFGVIALVAMTIFIWTALTVGCQSLQHGRRSKKDDWRL